MADSGQLDKLKEQYVDEVLSIVPLSQACFIILMVIVCDAIDSGKSYTVLHVLSEIGLKSSLGPNDGRFWDAGILGLCIAFVLALLNIQILRTSLSRSLRSSGVSSALLLWQGIARSRVDGLTSEQKSVIHQSIKFEVDDRLRKFRGKRIATEMTSSIFFTVFYSNIFLIIVSIRRDFSLSWDWMGFIFLLGCLIVCTLQHRASVKYAISKILPLKIYSSTLTGELVFFEDVSG
ncbi:hypothetical protein ACWYXK_26645 [Janthinobacterium lividum]